MALINWDAISQLPDQYEVVISSVNFNPEKLDESFSDVGNKTYMPKPELMYQIAEAKGIHGGDNSIAEPSYETVDVAEMTMEDVPNFQKMVVGYRCRKFSTVLEEDGTERRSSVCTVEYNVWNRVSELWAAEEEATQGYSIVEDGPYTYYNKPANGPHYTKVNGQYKNVFPVKYGTKWARKKHFKSELKFAMAKAETKAHEKTIRELAGLMTGYKADQLREGKLIFAKVRRSTEMLKAESVARLAALSKGIESKSAGLQLFGEPEPIVETRAETVPNVATIQVPAFQRLIDAIEMYSQAKLINDDLSGIATSMVGWLENERENAESNTEFWAKAIEVLKQIEGNVPEDKKISHNLY